MQFYKKYINDAKLINVKVPRKNISIISIVLIMIIGIIPVNPVDAAEKSMIVVPQSKQARNTSNVLSSYALYDNRLVIGFENLEIGKYKIYRKQSKKSWKLVKTFTVESHYSDGTNVYYDDWYEFIDKKVKADTRYYYKIYSCEKKIYSKAETYWTAVQHPKSVKQSGNIVKWKKSSGADGYLIYYHKRYVFLDGYFTDNKYYCKFVSKKAKSYKLPKGCKIDGIYSYSKNNGKYYLNWSGVHKSKNSIWQYVKDGNMTYVLKHKSEFI